MKPIRLPSNPRVLVVVLRRLGDVLLTTPLIHSIKRAYPDAAIEALVFAGTEGILAGNPELAGVIAMRQRQGAGASLALLRAAGAALRPRAVGPARRPADDARLGRRTAKRGRARSERIIGLTQTLGAQPVMRDRSARSTAFCRRSASPNLLGIPALPEIVCPAGAVQFGLLPSQPYAVVHAAPMFTYKRWRIDGWRQLVAALRARGLATIVTGGTADHAYLDEVWRECDVTRLDGKLTWPELAALIGGARVYIGPDTAVTHLAAAKATQTVALYGPTISAHLGAMAGRRPTAWWAAAGTIQHRGNVWLVQNPLPCLPCQLEGCERCIDSHSQCLDELTVSQVMAAVDQALAMRQAA